MLPIALAACGSGDHLVVESPAGLERSARPLRVPYPPPPASVEMLPLRRRAECLWRDGYWEWRASDWAWVDGAWVVPPEGCTYARSETHWERDGGTARLVYHPPEWQPEESGGKCAEPLACSTLLPESASETHDPLKTGQ